MMKFFDNLFATLIFTLAVRSTHAQLSNHYIERSDNDLEQTEPSNNGLDPFHELRSRDSEEQDSDQDDSILMRRVNCQNCLSLHQAIPRKKINQVTEPGARFCNSCWTYCSGCGNKLRKGGNTAGPNGMTLPDEVLYCDRCTVWMKERYLNYGRLEDKCVGCIIKARLGELKWNSLTIIDTSNHNYCSSCYVERTTMAEKAQELNTQDKKATTRVMMVFQCDACKKRWTNVDSAEGHKIGRSQCINHIDRNGTPVEVTEKKVIQCHDCYQIYTPNGAGQTAAAAVTHLIEANDYRERTLKTGNVPIERVEKNGKSVDYTPCPVCSLWRPFTEVNKHIRTQHGKHPTHDGKGI